MSDKESNGQGREPDKKPEIGREDVENLIDFGKFDDDIDFEEPEELSEPIEMQTVGEAVQLAQYDIEEVSVDLPEVLCEFDPENQVVVEQAVMEQVVVEQQVLDLAGVLVEERAENQMVERPHQMELACDETEQTPPQELMEMHKQVMNPSNQGPERQEIREPSNESSVNERQEPLVSSSDAENQEGNEETSGLYQGMNDSCLNWQPSGQGSRDQDASGGPSKSVEGSSDQGHSGPSKSDQNLEHPNMKRLAGSSPSDQDQMEVSSGLGDSQLEQIERQSELGPLESDNRPLLQRLVERYGTPSGEYTSEPSSGEFRGEQLFSGEFTEDRQIHDISMGDFQLMMQQLIVGTQEAVRAHTSRSIRILVTDCTPVERPLILEQNVESTDQIEADSMEQQEAMITDLNGGPDSGPDPGDQREKVGQVVVNEEGIAPPEAALVQPEDNVEADPDENVEIVPAEQDNLVLALLPVLPGPFEFVLEAIRRQNDI